MLFNRQGLQQKNWRMVKKGKHILFGCSLFFVLGGVSISGSQVAHASEINSSEEIAKEGAGNNTTDEKPEDNTSMLEKGKSVEGSNDKPIEKTTQNEDVEKSESNAPTKNSVEKEVNKKELKDLVDKIKKTDISKKTEKSVKELNLILSRAEKALDNKEITQEEIDKEVKALKEIFEKLEDKTEKEKVSEAKEKAESKKEEKSDSRKETSEKTQEGNKEDFARKHNEKITKVTETVTEIHSIANQINYEFSDAEKELVKIADKLPTAYNSDKYNEEVIQKLLKEVIYLRNKVANRMTREHSGKRDPRNGQPIDGKDESGFRITGGDRSSTTPAPSIQNNLNGKASSVSDVTVNAPVGSTVKLYDGNDVLIGEAVANAQGVAVVHPRNSLPEGTIKATATVGGQESEKSAPVNVTKTTTGSGGPIHEKPTAPTNTQILLSHSNIIAYRGDYVDVTIQAAANAIEKFWIHSGWNSVIGMAYPGDSIGGFLSTSGGVKFTIRKAYTRGTIDKTQPLGPASITYAVTGKASPGPASRTNPAVTKYVTLNFNILEIAKKYDISTDNKITVENPNNVSQSEKDKIIAAIKKKNSTTYTDTAYRKLLDDATYSVDEKGNVTITYPDNSIDKVASSYTIQKRPVIETSLTDKADTNTPITVSADPGSTVRLYDHTGAELGQGIADLNGRVTINPTRPIPNGNVTAKATDNRNNTTDPSIVKQATVPKPNDINISQTSHGATSVTLTSNGRIDIITATVQGKKVKLEKEANGRYRTLENVANVSITQNSNGSITLGLPAGNRFEVLDRIQVLAENKDITVASGIRSSNEVNQYVISNRVEKVPVKNINNLTPADKERVKAAYEKANPGINKSEVTVANNGNITYNHQGKGSIQKGEARLDGNVILDNTAPSKPIIETPLLEKAGTRTPIAISTEAGAKVEIFDSNDRKIGEKTADERGKVTIEPTADLSAGNITAKATDEAGNISQPSDPKQVTYKDFTPVVPAITLVTKVTNLTPVEIKEVKDKVQAANKGKTVEVSTNGTATVTDPISGFSHQISGTQLVDSKDKIKPTVEIPYSDASKQEIYIYSHEENNITIKVKDNSGKISNAYLAFAADNRQGLGQEDTSYLGGGSSDGLYLRTNSIKSETTATNTQPATITVSGNVNNQPYTSEKSITRYVYAEDPSGNTNYEHVGHANDNGALGRVRFVWKPQTFKYTATANSEKQTVSYGATPDAGTSVNKTGLPAGTKYAWATTPSTTTGSGEKAGVVTVTYPDGSKDTVNVTINVRALNDEYNLAATEIVVNQNDQVSNDKLKTVVSATSKVGKVDGTDKISSVVPKSTISTVNYGDQIVSAKVTFKDGTFKDVTIPIKVKDVTKPTITAPAENKNWEMTALDKTLPNMEVRAEDNANGSGIKSVSVTGLPDYLEYDKTTNSIKFKAGKQEVEKLPVNTPSKEFTLTIRAEDNAGNVSETTVKITVSSMSTKNTPAAKEQTVDNGSEPKAKDSIGNVEGLPSGTTFTWKDNTPPNTAVKTPGKVDGTVVVHYPDGTSEEVSVKVNVRGEDETYTPAAKEQTVDNGSEPKAKDSIGNVEGLPSGTTFTWKDNTPPNTAVKTPGKVDGTVVVHYPDGTSEEVSVKVNVRGEDETYTPAAKEQTVDNGSEPKAKDSIGNVEGLPSGTTFTWKDNTPPNTAVKTPGKVDGTVVVHYPDGTSEEVSVKVNVRGEDETYTPAAKEQTVDNGSEPKAKDSIGNVEGLPSGTTFTWKDNTPPNTAVKTPGKVDGTVVVHYPDGTSEEVSVKVNVRGEDETYTPAAKEQTVDNGSEPKAKDSIGNVEGLPSGTTFTWKDNTPPNTAVKTPGKVDGTVVVHYPDGTSEEVSVKVNVRGEDETYTPAAKEQTVDNGSEPKAKDSIGNVEGLPSGTTFTWKDNTPPNTAVKTPGKVDGTVVVHYPDGTSEEVSVKVNVRGEDETYTPAAKEQTVDNGSEPKAKDSIGNVEGLPSGTTFTWKDNTPPNTAVKTPGKVDGTVVVHYPDGTSEEVSVKVNVRGEDETYTPAAKEQTVDNGSEPKAKDSIGNVEGLPSGTTFTWKDNTPPNTAVKTPGKVDGTVVVHYPDGTSEEVSVKVNVRGEDETYTPAAKEQTVDNGSEPKAKDSIGNVEGLPSGTTFTWKDNTPPNTAVKTPGKVDGTVVVHYPDGTSEEVSVKVNVRGEDETYTPAAKEQTVDNGSEPKAKDSIGNVEGLPSGTTFTWKDNTPPNTAVKTPGKVDGTVVVHYPDGTSEEVSVKVNVRGEDETYTPAAKEQTVDNGSEPKAKDSIGNVEGLPSGTTFTWKDNTPPNTAVKTPGKVDGTVVVHYPDGTSEEVSVKVNVRGEDETYTPAAKEQTVDNGSEPKAKDSIGNVEGLPSGTTFTWKDNTPPNTAVKTPGKVDGTVVVHYPDGTSEEVSVKVNVRGEDETYTPAAKEQTVDNGSEPKAKDSIGNVEGLPSGTTFTWKDNTPPNTAVKTPGKVDGTVVVHYPDGTSEEVSVKVNVRGEDETYTPAAKEQTVDNGSEPKAKDSIGNVEGLPSGTTFTWKDNTPPNTAVKTPGKVDGTVVVHYPDGTSEEVSVKVNVRGEDETYTPAAKEQTVDNGSEPKAKDSIGNVEGLPSGTTFTWKDNTPPNTAVKTPGKVDGTVVVHYPDGTSEEVSVKVNVRGEDETYTPAAKEQTVDNGSEPKAKDSIGNVEGLPSGTTFTWKDNTPPNTAVKTPGKVDGTVVVHYPDGTSEEVSVKVNVRGEDETYTPAAKEQTVDNGSEPKAKDSIGNVEGLPSGTTFTWKDNTPPNTAVKTPGKVDGTVVVHYPDGTSEEVSVKVNVRGEDETYTPAAKEQTVDNGSEPKAKDSIGNVEGLPSGTTFTWKDNTPPNTAVKTPGKVDGTVVVHYPDGTSEEVSVKVNVRGEDETYTPAAKEQTVDNGSEPKAKDSIGNVEGLPSGTTFTWKDNTPPNTAVKTPGKVDGTVVVHYPDGTSEEVSVKVNVRGEDETYTPAAKEQTVDNGSEPKAKDSIGNVEGLPSGTTFTWKDNTPPNTAVKTPGKVDGTVVVHYPDGTSEEVSVKVNVRGEDETYTPAAKEQTVDNGSEPKAKDSIGNVEGLPSGTTFTWKDNTPPNTAVKTPGKVDGTVVVHYPDGTSEEVSVKVNVRGEDETYTPAAKEQTVDNGSEPKAKDSIGNVEGLPSGTTFTWKDNTPPNTAVKTPGKVDGTVVVHYPDGTSEEVSVKVNVRGEDETYTPAAKEQTVDNGSEPKAKDSIGNVEGLPSGTTFTWKDNTPPNTAVKTPGKVDGTVVVHYPDGTSEEVSVKVNVRGEDETYTPAAKEQTVDNGSEPKAKDSIGNVEGLPSGTTFTWKDNTPPNTAVKTPGKVDGTVVVHYPDGTSEEVSVKVNVRGEDETYTPAAKEQTVDNGSEPKAKDSIGNVEGLPSGTTFTWKDNTPPNTAVKTPGKVDGTVVVHYPDGTSEEVSVKVNVRQSHANGIPEVQPSLPEFSGGVNGDSEVQPELPEFNGGVNGIPEEQPELPEFNGGANGNPEIQPTLPEFSGGVNGDPEIRPEVQKNNLIITRWIDENGNELKPADAKYPKVLGELNEAFDHGEIKGYVFVRTEVDNSGEVVTHIFRKVSNTVITSSNHVEESTKFNKTLKAPKRLANTGQLQNNSELAGLGLAIVGLFAAIKRRKNEEE